MKNKGIATISSILAVAALALGGFYFLLSQISHVGDKADAASLSALAVAGDVKAIKQAVDDLKSQETSDKADINKNLDILNNKLNLVISRQK